MFAIVLLVVMGLRCVESKQAPEGITGDVWFRHRNVPQNIFKNTSCFSMRTSPLPVTPESNLQKASRHDPRTKSTFPSRETNQIEGRTRASDRGWGSLRGDVGRAIAQSW